MDFESLPLELLLELHPEVYEVSPSVDPNALIEADFEQNGFIYHMTSIVKDAIMVEDEVEVTQEYEVTVSVSDGDKAKAFDQRLFSINLMLCLRHRDFQGVRNDLRKQWG